jgi:tetratricopeptide (TPR) repeat protein
MAINVFGKIIDPVEGASSINSYFLNLSKKRDTAGGETEFTIGKTYFDSGDYSNAFRHFRKSLQLNPAYTMAYLYISRIYQEKNMLNDARKILETGINYIPAYSFFTELTKIYSKLGMKMRIGELWKKYIEKFPDNEKGYLNLGNFYSSCGQNSKAITFFEKVLVLKKDNVAVREEIGDIYFNNGNFEEAGRIFREIFNSTDNSGIRTEIGKKLIDIDMKLNNIEDAVILADELSNFITDDIFLIKIADVFIASQDFKKAFEILEKSRKINPLNYNVYYRYAFLSALKGNVEEMEKNLKLVIKFIENPAILNFLNNIENYDNNDAIKLTRELLSKNSNIDEILLSNFNSKTESVKKKIPEEKIIDDKTDFTEEIKFIIKTMENMNIMFEKQVENQFNLIGEIVRTVEKANQMNLSEISKISDYIEAQTNYYYNIKNISEKNLEQLFEKTGANIKKVINFSSKTNKVVFHKINEFRKKSIKIHSDLEKHYYNLNKLKKMSERAEKIDKIASFLSKIIEENKNSDYE